MLLLRDLWSTSPRRTGFVAALVVAGAFAAALAAPLAGQVLAHKSGLAFVGLAAALAIAVLADLLVGLVTASLTSHWSADVRRRLCRVALGQDLQTLESTPVGELLDRIDSDVHTVGSQLRGPAVRIVQLLGGGAAAILTAFAVWWPAGVVFALVTAVLAVTLRRRVQAIAQAQVREEEAWSDLAAVVEEAVHGQDDVRTALGRPYVLRLYAERAAQVLRTGRVVWHRGGLVNLTITAVIRLGIIAVIAGGTWMLTEGRIDGARLTAVWLLAIAFGGGVELTGHLISELQSAIGAWSRVSMLMTAPQEPRGGLPPVDGDLRVRGLTFTYPASQERRPVLRDVDLDLVRGRSYALIGRTGSGKSTLAKVLTRSVDVPRGTVTLGGVDICDIDLELLRRWVAVVPQRTEIVAGTLVDNVALFDDSLRPAALRALAELGLTEWVADLPDGADTRLGDGGHVLSAGQEQLVAFARILVREPHVVILDEATARMDPVTEARVHAATERLLTGRIGIVIAHRLSSVRRCDDVVVLADGAVVEAGPREESARFAALLARGGGSVVVDEIPDGDAPGGADADPMADPVVDPAQGPVVDPAVPVMVAPERTDPPQAPTPPPARTIREVARIAVNDARFGLLSLLMFFAMIIFGLEGSVLPWLWADLVADPEGAAAPALGIVVALVLTLPFPYLTARRFPEWWVRQMLRISLRLVHGQTGPRRISTYTPAEVVAQGGDTERVVIMADNLMDQVTGVVIMTTMTAVSGSWIPAAFFLSTIVASAVAALLFGPVLHRRAQATVAARAAFATSLVSSLAAARSVKLAGASSSVLAHLARLDTERSSLQAREIRVQVWSRSTPALMAGLLPIGVWALYLADGLTAGAALVATSTLSSARWFAWTTASLVSSLPSARVWTRRTVAMAGVSEYSSNVPGVDISAGTAPAPQPAPRTPLARLELAGFTAVHDDGTVGVADVDLTVARGQLVLVVGPVGSGKSSLLRALAGIVHHRGDLRWNDETVDEPSVFLRPNQVGYVGQMPRVLSGTVAENIRLGHDVDALAAVAVAQLEHDLRAADAERDLVGAGARVGSGPTSAEPGAAPRTMPAARHTGGAAGMDLLIGHKGTRLSGGQLQRLALARALAPQTELLLADDVSSALDVTTELDLWHALRSHGVTVVGATSKRAALAQADHVVVLVGGRVAAQGPWSALEDDWGHLAG